MSAPQRHHYVPQMLLRRFTNDSGWLFVFNKHCPEKGVLRLWPSKVLVEKHLYTQHDIDGSKDYSIEKILSRIEGDASGIVEEIVSAGRAMRLPNLTAERKFILDLFFSSQAKRTPSMLHGPGLSENEVDDILQRVERKYTEKTGNPLTKAELDFHRSPAMIKNYKADSVRIHGSFLRLINCLGIVIVVVKDSRKSFVIGDNPIVKTINDNPRSATEKAWWLPIAHDIAVVVSSIQPHGTERFFEINGGSLRRINELTAKQSAIFCGRSPELIKSLARDVVAPSN